MGGASDKTSPVGRLKLTAEFSLALQELEIQNGKIHWPWDESVVPGPHDLVIFNSLEPKRLLSLARQSAAQVVVLYADAADSSKLLETWYGLLDWVWPQSGLLKWRDAHSDRWTELMFSANSEVRQSPSQGRSALLLDRDGILNVDHGYVGKADDVQLPPGIVPLLKRFQLQKWPSWVVTNQSGIARGYYSEKDFQTVMARVGQLLDEHGLVISGEEHSFFHPTAQEARYRWGRQFRKPRPGMIHRARERAGLDLSQSVFVGDRATDLMASWLAGVGHGYLLRHRSEGHAEWNIFARWRKNVLEHGAAVPFEPATLLIHDLSEVIVP